MGKKKTIEQFRQEMFLINPNIEVLGEYINNKTKILVRDKRCNHKWNSSNPHDLLKGTRCPICRDIRRRKTTKEFINELEIKNSNIEILGEYIDSKTKIKVRSKICSHNWETTPDILLQGCGCPICRYNLKTTEQFVNEMKELNPNIKILEEYNGVNNKILVKDKICGYEWNTSTPAKLLNGAKCPRCTRAKKLKDRSDEIAYNNVGEKMTIIKYNSRDDISIMFEDGSLVENRRYGHFIRGEITNPYYKSFHGVGYFGEGIYVASINKKTTNQYLVWKNMLDRCYDLEYQTRKQSSYINCSVCDEWLCFQNFGKWYDENFYQVDNEVMCLDKDILVKNNKIYSPNTCMFVPEKINLLFVKNNASRGNYPIGVCLHTNSYMARYSNTFLGKGVYLGLYSTPEQAFKVYKFHKEKHIKEVADYYKDKIPYKLYYAMYDYKVEITD